MVVTTCHTAYKTNLCHVVESHAILWFVKCEHIFIFLKAQNSITFKDMPLLEYLQAALLTQRQNQLEVAVYTTFERHGATTHCVAVQKEHHATDRNTTVFIQYPTR